MPTPQYSIQANADNLFRFLTRTFFSMPRTVQVVGWCILLLLFVSLVLYPILGITYYEGRVVTLGFDEQQKPHMSPAAGTMVTKGTSALTNQNGEFTLGVRTPYLPLKSIELLFAAPGVEPEEVAVDMPLPFVSLFRPNLQKVYYVPGSTLVYPSGFYVRHYFLDAKRAKEALDSSASGTQSSREHAVTGAVGGLGVFRLSMEAHAAAPTRTPGFYTLRLRELTIAGIKTEAQVYFELRADGRPLRADTLPTADSSKLRDLTVFPASPARFDALYVPVSQATTHIDIAVRERMNFYKSDTPVGSVGLDLSASEIGKVLSLSSKTMQVTVELLPPATIACAVVPAKKGGYFAAFGLDVARDSLKYIDRLQYDIGPNFDDRFIASPNIEPFDFYTHTLWIVAAQPVKARIDFGSGSTLNLATLCNPGAPKTQSPVEYYLLARAHLVNGDREAALQGASSALLKDQRLAAAIALKGDILAAQGDYRTAASEYDRAIALAPNSPQVLNSYARMVAEHVPNPGYADLVKAAEFANRAVQLVPNPGYYDTLGWIEFRLHKNENALNALTKASELQRAITKKGIAWQEISYHLARVNEAIGKKAEASQHFQAVVEFGAKYPAISKETYVRAAQEAIQRNTSSPRQRTR